MNKINPLVSIIVNYWESIKYLDKCIDSIQNQTYTNWELIFVDNNSRKSPWRVLKKISKNKLKYYKLKKYQPLGQARNYALKKCKGDYIAFLDSDDFWLNEKIELQIKEFKKDKKIGIVICESNFIINNKIINKKNQIIDHKKSYLENLIYSNFIVMSSAIIKKSVIEEHRIKFNKNFEVLEDTLFFFELIFVSNLFLLNKKLCLWRYRKNSHTFTNTNKLLKEKFYFRNHYLNNPKYNSKISDDSMLNFNLNLKILEASSSLRCDSEKESRKILRPFIKKSLKLVIIYYLSFLPKNICFFIYERIFKRPLI